MTISPCPEVTVTQLPSRRAKASFSTLVSRADLLGEVTVLTKHGRPAALIVTDARRDPRTWSAATIRAEDAAAQVQATTLQALEAAEESALLSRTLQESLLPPHLPTIPGAQLAVRYLRGGRGADVLGDFYDVFASPRGAWGVVVGDLAGKGPQAAKTTALARYTLRAAAVRCTVPSTNLATLNTALLEWFTDDTAILVLVLPPGPEEPAQRDV